MNLAVPIWSSWRLPNRLARKSQKSTPSAMASSTAVCTACWMASMSSSVGAWLEMPSVGISASSWFCSSWLSAAWPLAMSASGVESSSITMAMQPTIPPTVTPLNGVGIGRSVVAKLPSELGIGTSSPASAPPPRSPWLPGVPTTVAVPDSISELSSTTVSPSTLKYTVHM
jgi:hypothetical protein